MKLKTILRRPLALALSLLLCAVCLTPGVSAVRAPGAIEGFDANKVCSLTVNYPHAGEADTRPRVTIYQVAGVDENVIFTPVGGFAGIEGLKDDLAAARRTGDWFELVPGLQNAAESGNFAKAGGSPKQVDGGGQVQFTGLKPGLYLVTAENYQRTVSDGRGGTVTTFYTPSSYLICLPNYVESGGSGQWAYDIVSTAKVREDNLDKIQIHVFKVWDDQNDRQGIRPESVTVALLRGGVIVEQATLHAGNGWKHTWYDLDNSGPGQWSVTELNAPAGYRFTISKTGTNLGWTFTVENYLPTTPPPRPSDPTPEEPEEPEIPLDDPEVPKSEPPDEPPPPDDEVEIPDEDVPLSDLPQTGQLWWPVPFLAVGGMFFLLIGALRRRRDTYDEE